MDMRQLKYFARIVESGSLSKASRQLFIAQPSLSQQMARLEEEVGKPLLVRSTRGVLPTANGEALYHHAKLMLRQLDEAVIIARQESTDIQGRVVVGMVPSTEYMVALPLLQEFKEKYPRLVLNVISARLLQLEDMVRRSELDVAILSSQMVSTEMTSEPLLDERVFVIVPRGSPLVPRGRASLTLAEVAALPMVLSSPHNHLRRRFMAELERAKLTLNLAAEVDSLPLTMRFVAEGGGATLQTMAATHILTPRRGWRCVPIADVLLERPNYLYALPAGKLSKSGALVCAGLRSIVRGLVESGAWSEVRLAQAHRPPGNADDNRRTGTSRRAGRQ
ncbi:LysR substrate-binding domain-containing protein [Xylophilus sp. GW821-FHT01B05]